MNHYPLKQRLDIATALKSIIAFWLLLAVVATVSADSPKPQKPAYMTAKMDQVFNELQIAANNGDTTGQIILGILYFKGIPRINDQPEIPKDTELGKAWFLKAIEHGGGACAMALLAHSYEHEPSSANYSDQVVYWYLQASKHGSIDAQAQLIKLYENGQYLPKNDLEIPRWIINTAEFGIVDSYEKAVDLYLEGRGVNRNLMTAYKWVSMAIRHDPNNIELIEKQQALAARLTDLQRISVENLLKTWKPKHDATCDKFLPYIR